jgi:hypothetical protein
MHIAARLTALRAWKWKWKKKNGKNKKHGVLPFMHIQQIQTML